MWQGSHRREASKPIWIWVDTAEGISGMGLVPLTPISRTPPPPIAIGVAQVRSVVRIVP